MKKMMTLLSVFLLSMTFYCGHAEAGENKPINWERENGPGRSIFPIAGYVDKEIVTIYLYESPAEVTVCIMDESGCIIYENAYADREAVVIDMDGEDSGSFQITVEYEDKIFSGIFHI